jgi:uncharacterized protein YecE (DUF72 family)
MTRPGDVRIGISGWRYKPWRGTFYPEGLRQAGELSYASSILNSIEINGTFYSLQRPKSFTAWAAQTPADFVFSVKAPRYITHLRRLKEVEKPLANFLASGVLELKEKLGPVLWQFPPSFKFDASRLEAFFAMLPHDTDTATAVARGHDAKVEGRSAIPKQKRRRLRHAIEIRHDSFRTPEFIELLRAHDIALVCADTVDWPRLMDVTSEFMYLRLHGSEELYASGYDDEALDAWADRVAAWASGAEPADAERVIDKAAKRSKARNVFVYFDNDMKVRAPIDAQGLRRRMEARLAGK